MHLRSSLTAVVAALAFVSVARADSVSVGFNTGTVNTTSSIITYKTTGSGVSNSMAGMAVTFSFTDGSTATSYWASGSNSIGASNGVTLSLSGDSYFSQWELANSNGSGLGVTKMVIDAGLGDTIFDRTFGTAEGTANSASGKDFKPTTGKAGLNIIATYSDAVKVGLGPVVGDLFRTLTVDFLTAAPKGAPVPPNDGFKTGSSMKFWLDTDSVEPLTTPSSIKTPAPPALLLGLLGAVPLFLRRRPV